MLTRSREAEGSPTPASEAPRAAPVRGSGADRQDDYPATTALLTLLTIASAAGFARIFATAGWLGPVMCTAIITHGVAWGLRRRGVSRGPATLVGVVVVAALGAYLVFPADLTFGLPLRPEWHAIGAALTRDQHDFPSMTAPVPVLPGFTLLAVWGVGLMAVLSDLLAFRFRSALEALAPPFAVFVACCTLGTIRGRFWSVGLEVAAMLAFFLGHRVTVGREDVNWFGGRRAGASGWALALGAASAAAAVVAALVVIPVVPRAEGVGVLGWKAGSGGDVNRITPSPLDDLRTRLIQESQVPVMTVQSSQPSYWRLTSLDTFTGTLWESNDSYEGFRGKLPGVASPPKGTRTVVENFHIQALDSIWLPSAFDPEEVTGGHQITWDPTSGSLISSQATANGQNYQVTSLEVLATLSPKALSAVPVVKKGSIERYLQLPTGLPPVLESIERSITAGAHTEYAKAVALQSYFHTSAFSYSLAPPSDDSANALVNFLTKTKIGYCQQYAGAYAVLARLAGLPTRIAIGFQTGTYANGTYQVTDADAHAWPEVYFPTLGWIPFEPTPAREIPGASAYTGVTSTQTAASLTTTDTTPTTLANTPAPHNVAGLQPTSTTTLAPAPAPRHHTSAVTTLLWIGIGIASALAFVALGMGVIGAGRRARWRRRTRAGQRSGAARVLTAWAEAIESLAWWQVRRRGDESATEFAERAAHETRVLLGETYRQGPDFVELAILVERVEFAAEVSISDKQARHAEATARDLTTALEEAASGAKRFRRLLDPREVWGPVTVAAPSAVLPLDVELNLGTGDAGTRDDTGFLSAGSWSRR